MASLYDKLFLQILYQILYQILDHSKNNFEILPKPNIFYGPDLTQDFKLTINTYEARAPLSMDSNRYWPNLLIPIYYWWAQTQTTRHDLQKFAPISGAKNLGAQTWKNPCPRIRKAALLLIKQRFFWLLGAFLTIKHLSRQHAKKRRFSWLPLRLFSDHSSYTNKR